MASPLCTNCRSALLAAFRISPRSANTIRPPPAPPTLVARPGPPTSSRRWTSSAVTRPPASSSNSLHSRDANHLADDPSHPRNILAKPTWSVRSLLSAGSDLDDSERITPQQLHHLLRLSALPLPTSADEEARMISTLQSQLRFVRDVRSVDTTDIEPLRSLRDETSDGIRASALGLEDLKEALGKEVNIGHYGRPRRRPRQRLVGAGEEKETAEPVPGVEDWEPLETASRTAGQYFVVKSSKE